MDRKFWLERWATNQIGFHQPNYNPELLQYWSALGVPVHASVFVPLCGKSLDMRWLETVGHTVYGVDYSAEAISAYFADAQETPECDQGNYLMRFKGPSSTLYAGNFFDISAIDLPRVRGVFDRGALVALPCAMRSKYADHLQRVIPDGTNMLLLTLEYDQVTVAGPPFSVGQSEVEALFQARSQIELLDSMTVQDLPPKFAAAGLPEVTQAVYHITKVH